MKHGTIGLEVIRRMQDGWHDIAVVSVPGGSGQVARYARACGPGVRASDPKQGYGARTGANALAFQDHYFISSNIVVVVRFTEHICMANTGFDGFLEALVRQYGFPGSLSMCPKVSRFSRRSGAIRRAPARAGKGIRRRSQLGSNVLLSSQVPVW